MSRPNALRQAGVSGWSTYPVEVTGKSDAAITGLNGLGVTGRCGPIDNQRSAVVKKPPVSSQGRPFTVLTGLFFDEASWDGSDLFMPTGSAWICATPRAKSALEDAGITNIRFTRLTEVERDPMV